MWVIVVYNNGIPLGILIQQHYTMTNKDMTCDANVVNKIGMRVRCKCDHCANEMQDTMPEVQSPKK